jgi:hypothetical protein
LLRRFVLLFVLFTGLAFAQVASPAAENTPTSTDSDLVTCGERPPYASRTLKSEPMVAPDGKHKAYSEVEATALHPQRPAGYSGPLCVNNSHLFVTGDNGEFKLRFMQEPADVENGNSLRLIDWSSDGRRLLAELAEWQYEQPGVSHSILLYDSRYGTFQQPEFPHLLAKTYDHDCSLDFRVLGFGLQGKIVLEGNPLTPEEEEIQGLSSCVKKKTYFELDRATETLVSVQEMPKVQHNAKSEASK